MVFLSCSNSGEKLQQELNKNSNQNLILFSLYRSTGQCLWIETNEKSIIKRCSKYNRGLCSSNLLIITEGEKTKLISDVTKLLNNTSECRDSILRTGLLSTASTSAENEKTIKQKNEFIGVESCETSEFPNYSKLVSLSELIFLSSFRGKIGKEAENLRKNVFLSSSIKNNAEACLNKEFSESERNLISDIILKNKLEEDTVTLNR